MAKKRTMIEVTQADLDNAIRNNSARCVVATAIARSIEGARNVSIDVQTVRFTVGDDRRIYLTPPAASGYVVAFDAGDELHPFRFALSEDYRVQARRDKPTAANKERRRVDAAAARAERRAAKAIEVAESETHPARAVVAAEAATAAQEAADRAKTVQSETYRDLAGEPYWIPDHEPDPSTGERKRKAPPQAYKRQVRTYGQRQLRINQAPDNPKERAARRAVTAAYDAEAGPES